MHQRGVWEYQAIHSKGAAMSTDQMNYMGARGWEFVAETVMADGARAVWRRPRPDASVLAAPIEPDALSGLGYSAPEVPA